MPGGSATVSETGVLSKVIIIIGMEWQGQNICAALEKQLRKQLCAFT